MRIYNMNASFSEFYIIPVYDHADKITSSGFLGRLVEERQADPSRPQEWLKTCEDHHGSICQSLYHQHNPSEQPGAKIRLIDVNQMCLVKATMEAKFITLSHVWGAVPFLRLLRKNYLALHEIQELLFKELPRTFQDVIQFVRQLGYHYIWIDSLCIIQDDQNDWVYTSQLMDRIYGSSIMTICAASGSDPQAGLPGALPHSRTLLQQRERCNSVDLMITRSVEGYIQDSA